MVIQLLFWREKARKLKAPSKQSHGFSPAGAVCLFAQQIQTASCCTRTCASLTGIRMTLVRISSNHIMCKLYHT